MERRYDEQTLNTLHSVELDMLRTFVHICDKYDINYFCTFGTAIGAVRHGGFIPWDDDIDIGMLRSEYERLRQVPEDEWGPDFFIADARDECVFHRTLFPRMYKRGTAFESLQYYKYLKPQYVEKYPIYVDIFLFDTFDKPQRLNTLRFIADLYKRLILYSKCRFKIYKEDGVKIAFASVIKNALSFLLSLDKNSSRKLYNSYYSIMNHFKNGKYITCFELVDTYEAKASLCLKDQMFPSVDFLFGDITIKLQKNYDQILRSLYGDYMTFPPEEKRYNPLPRVLDFNDGRGNVVSNYWKE